MIDLDMDLSMRQAALFNDDSDGAAIRQLTVFPVTKHEKFHNLSYAIIVCALAGSRMTSTCKCSYGLSPARHIQ
ncbi:hypothetical protein C241_02544 [Bradyrhizobium lupini HPC(L)]|uniref:Uncharacterized protein n=1 Tax=Bradyrhizobium lupini HPC(L) TaxID=1229491 RepID=A0ABN0HRK9_RHILU|nr:hypothetical protein C241_02544 [Bradyrhizobium lupini HPC(L)]